MKRYADLAFMRKCTISLLLVIYCTIIIAQDIPIGSWRSHFSYNKINSLAKTDWGIFGAADHGVLQILNDNSLSTLSKTNGLSGAQITCIGGDGEYLFVGHKNGEIDIVSEDQIINILDLRNSDLVGSKTINDVVRQGDLAYFATNFGIVVVDLKIGAIKENYRSIGIGGSDIVTNELEIQNNQLYVVTNVGIQKGLLSKNLLDFTQWEFYQDTTFGRFSNLTSNGSQLLTISGDTALVDVRENSLSVLYQSDSQISHLTSDGIAFFIVESDEIFTVSDGQLDPFKNIEAYHVNDILFDEGLWLADSFQGVITPNQEPLAFNGPQSDQFTKIKILKNELFGFYNSVKNDNSISSGYETFDGADWIYNDISQFQHISDASYFNNELFLASSTSGVFKVSDSLNFIEQEAQFLPSNDRNLFEISSMTSNRNNLWVASYDNTLPLLSFDGEVWSSYNVLEVGASFPEEIQISERGLLWIRGDSQNGLLVFDSEEKANTNINSGKGLPSNSINSFEINDNDEVWIGTTRGIGNFPEASFAFDPFQAIVPVFGGQLLFNDTQVSSVLSDGGNRLWTATSLGLWLFDSNISTLIHQFNTTNSPLPSNNILQLAYNRSNGELFILTDQGLVSYRTASSAGRSLYNSVEIFPNPIPPSYNGTVGIQNLLENSTVKISDINGKLIKELTSDGGTASWNLTDLGGKKINTGVYLVFMANVDGSESFVGKIAVVN